MILLWVMACDGTVEDTTPPVDTQVTHHATYESAKACGACHPVHYWEWSQSMHAYAAKSPVFDAMAAKAWRDTSGGVGSFCTRCHTPFGEFEGEPGNSVAAERSELSLEGVSCDYCHTAVGHDGVIANTRQVNEPGRVKQGPIGGGDYGAHEGQYGEFLTSPELCGTCHDVVSDGLRIEEAYTEYIASPAAAEGTRCQDCHMSPEPGVDIEREMIAISRVNGVDGPIRSHASHRFIGPDYSLLDSFPWEDDPEGSALAREDMNRQIQTLLGNAAMLAAVNVTPTERTLQIQVAVQSLVNAHNVPTGFTSERQMWLHVRVTDSLGNVAFESGGLDENQDLYDTHSEVGPVDDSLVNYQSTNLLVKRNNGRSFEVETIFPFDANAIVKHSLEPNEIRLHTWETADLPSTLWTVEVSLNYRNLPPYVFRALGADHLIERLQVFTIDSWSGTVQL